MKTRTVAKYAALGVLTTVYAGGLTKVLKPELLPNKVQELATISPKQVAVGGGSMLALTWLVATL